MPESSLELTEHPLLEHFAGPLEGFRPPEGRFDPRGAWKNTYDLVECIGRVGRHGALSVERAPLPDGRARLSLAYRKRAGGGTVRFQAQVECAGDALAAPASWRIESATSDPAGAVIDDTRLVETGAMRDGAIALRLGSSDRRIPVFGPLAMNWALFDAVQRLPREPGRVHRFSLVDRLSGQVKPNQTLAFRESVDVVLGGKMVWGERAEPLEAGTRYRPVARREGGTRGRLHIFEQFGEGILPITYWVTDDGRLLFVLSGLIGYLYNPDAQV